MAGKLQPLISSMLSEAMIAKDSRRHLGHGLRVGIQIQGTHVVLMLARDGQYPSRQEWDTILKHWPYHATVLEYPKEIQQGNVYYLRSVVTTETSQERML